MQGWYGYRGAGKTLSVVAELWQQFQWNDELIVLSNTPLNLPKHPKSGKSLKWFFWKDIEDVVTFFNFAMEYGDKMMSRRWIVFIDEASVILNARFWKDTDPALAAFMFQSRHVNVEIFFTTQHPSMVEPNLRKITETWVKCEKLILLNLIPTPFIMRTDQELTPDGQVVQEYRHDLVLRVRKYWPMYNTTGKDSMVGLGRSLQLASGAKPNAELYDFLKSIVIGDS